MDNLDFWKSRLRGDAALRPEKPTSGRYRLPPTRGGKNRYEDAAKDPIAYPVAVQFTEGALNVWIGNKRFADGSDEFAEFAARGWQSCEAVSVPDYNSAREKGIWPDGVKSAAPVPRAAEIGDNSGARPRIADEAIEAADRALANPLLKREPGDLTDEQADSLGNLKQDLTRLESNVTAAKREARKPLDDEIKRLIAPYDEALSRVDKSKRTLSAFIAKILDIRRERERKKLAEKINAGDNVTAKDVKAAASVKVGSGRGVRQKKRRFVTITDADAFFAWVSKNKVFRAHPDVEDRAKIVALQSIDVGLDVPGIKIDEEKVAA